MAKKLSFQETLFIAKEHPDENIRINAAKKVIRGYVRSGCYRHLREMSENTSFPINIRELAKNKIDKAAEWAVKINKDPYQTFYGVSLDYRFPEDTRRAAADNALLGASFERNYKFMLEMSKEKSLSEDIRKSALKQIIHTCVNAGSSGYLDQIYRDNEFPEDIRELAVNRAIDHDIEIKEYGYIKGISESMNLPENIRKIAKDRLVDLVKDLANKIKLPK